MRCSKKNSEGLQTAAKLSSQSTLLIQSRTVQGIPRWGALEVAPVPLLTDQVKYEVWEGRVRTEGRRKRKTEAAREYYVACNFEPFFRSCLRHIHFLVFSTSHFVFLLLLFSTPILFVCVCLCVPLNLTNAARWKFEISILIPAHSFSFSIRLPVYKSKQLFLGCRRQGQAFVEA